MDHKWIVVLATVLVVGLSVLSVRYINQSFLPDIDQGQFEVGMELPPGTPLEITEREALKVEEIIRSHPDVADVFATIGATSSPNVANFVVQVVGGVEAEVSSRDIIAELRPPLAGVPGISFQLSDDVTGGDTFVGNRDIIIEMVAFSGSYEQLGQGGGPPGGRDRQDRRHYRHGGQLQARPAGNADQRGSPEGGIVRAEHGAGRFHRAHAGQRRGHVQLPG
ncbi:MAG: efflux RND transporter permease subunit [Caldilineaceae bacterium]